jgi:sugar/nucleoside kinase (ribokinase family)
VSRIVGVGRPTLDRLVAVPRAPVFDAGMTVRSFGTSGGGQVATALVAVARLGWEAALIARVGEDEAGAEIIHGLAADGVETGLIQVAPQTRSATSIILVDPSASRSILHDPGEGTDPDFTGEAAAAVGDAAGLMLERHSPPSLAAARLARQRGVPVMLDAGGHTTTPAQFEELARLSTVVIASAYHAEGRELDPEGAARELTDLGAEIGVVTLGDQGAVGIAAGRVHREPAYPVEAVDTTGAGDVYHGAFFVAYLEGQALPQAMRFAAIVAALKCRRPGGRAGIPTRAEVEAILSAAS